MIEPSLNFPSTFAEKVRQIRGWIPRRCAVEVLDNGFVDQPEMDGDVGGGDVRSDTKKDK